MTERRDKATITKRDAFETLVRQIRAGQKSLSQTSATSGMSCSPVQVSQLIAESIRQNPDANVVFAGTVTGKLTLRQAVPRDLILSGEMKAVNVSCTIGGGLSVTGRVGGALNVTGEVGTGVSLRGETAGNFNIRSGAILRGPLSVRGLVGADLHVRDGSLIEGNVYVTMDGAVSGDLNLDEGVVVGGNLDIRGVVQRHVRVNAEVQGSVDLSGAAEMVSFEGSVGGRTSLRPTSPLSIASVRGAEFGGPVRLGEHINLTGCDFRSFAGFEQLLFAGSHPFAVEGGRQILLGGDEGLNGISYREIASIHRQLRVVLERQGNRPGSSDFYFGEMEARRRAAWGAGDVRSRIESLILFGYRWLSAYGTRASLAIVIFFAVAGIGSVLFAVGGIDLSMAGGPKMAEFTGGWDWSDRLDLLLFSLRSMVSFVRPPSADLTTAEGYLQLALRFLGPLLLAQAILAIRERVVR